MERTYIVKLHQDERVGAMIAAKLYRVTDEDGLQLVAEVHRAGGPGAIFEAFAEQLIIHHDERGGELP